MCPTRILFLCASRETSSQTHSQQHRNTWMRSGSSDLCHPDRVCHPRDCSHHAVKTSSRSPGLELRLPPTKALPPAGRLWVRLFEARRALHRVTEHQMDDHHGERRSVSTAASFHAHAEEAAKDAHLRRGGHFISCRAFAHAALVCAIFCEKNFSKASVMSSDGPPSMMSLLGRPKLSKCFSEVGRDKIW